MSEEKVEQKKVEVKKEKKDEVLEFDLTDKDMQRISQMRKNEEALKNRALVVMKNLVAFIGENQMVEQQKQEAMRILQEKFEIPADGEFEVFPEQKKLKYKKK